MTKVFKPIFDNFPKGSKKCTELKCLFYHFSAIQRKRYIFSGNRPILFQALSCPPPPYPLPRPRPQRGSSTPPPDYPPSTQRNSLFIIFIVLRQIKGLFYLGNGRSSASLSQINLSWYRINISWYTINIS